MLNFYICSKFWLPEPEPNEIELQTVASTIREYMEIEFCTQFVDDYRYLKLRYLPENCTSPPRITLSYMFTNYFEHDAPSKIDVPVCVYEELKQKLINGTLVLEDFIPVLKRCMIVADLTHSMEELSHVHPWE